MRRRLDPPTVVILERTRPARRLAAHVVAWVVAVTLGSLLAWGLFLGVIIAALVTL